MTVYIDSPTQVSVTWICNHLGDSSRNEFRVTYQLINLDQCDRGDGSHSPPFNLQTTEWGEWNRQNLNDVTHSTHVATLMNLVPFSAYRVRVVSRDRENGATWEGSINQPVTSPTGISNILLTSVVTISYTKSYYLKLWVAVFHLWNYLD